MVKSLPPHPFFPHTSFLYNYTRYSTVAHGRRLTRSGELWAHEPGKGSRPSGGHTSSGPKTDERAVGTVQKSRQTVGHDAEGGDELREGRRFRKYARRVRKHKAAVNPVTFVSHSAAAEVSCRVRPSIYRGIYRKIKLYYELQM